ncbi:MAG: DCC1-like thiol-disulfide oxidoreductase family protein [Bacteroidota bacterium]
MQHASPIIFYDGLCGLCDKSVQFVLKHDKKQLFRFATLQSDYAKQILGDVKEDSFVLYDNNTLYMRSTAALRTAKHLSGLWPLLYALVLVPAFIRDGVYRFIAQNRYKWFGKYDSCKIPDAATQSRFIA